MLPAVPELQQTRSSFVILPPSGRSTRTSGFRRKHRREHKQQLLNHVFGKPRRQKPREFVSPLTLPGLSQSVSEFGSGCAVSPCSLDANCNVSSPKPVQSASFGWATSRTAGVLSQLRWDVSKGRRPLRVVSAADALRDGFSAGLTVDVDGAVSPSSPYKSSVGGDCGGFAHTSSLADVAGGTTFCKGAGGAGAVASATSIKSSQIPELRRFRAVLLEELQECNTFSQAEAVSSAVAAAISSSSPGVSGSFVVLDAPVQRCFLRVLVKEVQDKKAIIALCSEDQPRDRRTQERRRAAIGSIGGGRAGKAMALVCNGPVISMTAGAPVTVTATPGGFGPIDPHVGGDGNACGWVSEGTNGCRGIMESAGSGRSTATVLPALSTSAQQSHPRRLSHMNDNYPAINDLRNREVAWSGFGDDASSPAATDTIAPAQLASKQPPSIHHPMSSRCASAEVVAPASTAVTCYSDASLSGMRGGLAIASRGGGCSVATDTETPSPQSPAALDASDMSDGNASPSKRNSRKARLQARTKRHTTRSLGQVEEVERSPARAPGLSTFQRRATEIIRKRKMQVPNASVFAEESLVKLFKRVSDDNELHHDNINRVLKRVGFAKPDQSWVDQIFMNITYCTTLASDEFVRFVQEYNQKQDEFFAETFRLHDKDQSGTLDRSEIENALKQFGMVPMKHVLDQMMKEVDPTGGTSMIKSEDNFKRLAHLVRVREGFSRKEYDDFMHAYKCYDRDGSGELDVREFTGLLNWLGFAHEVAWVQRLVEEFDEDGSSLLSESEFLVCMSKVREREIASLSAVIARCDVDGTGTLTGTELDEAFRELGYSLDPLVVVEAIKNAGVEAAAFGKGLGLSELWRILCVVRGQEGLTREESQDIQLVFERYDPDHTGEIGHVEVGKALRWLGCHLTFEQQQGLISQVDLDESGKVDLPEFRKLVRMCIDREMVDISTAFIQHAAAEGGQCISLKHVTTVLSEVNCTDEEGEPFADVSQVIRSPLIDRLSFLQAARSCRRVGRRRFRDHGCFSAHELDRLREGFNQFDQDQSGDIGRQELITLIEKIFPTLAHSQEERPRLQKLLQSVDSNGSGSIEFDEYVMLMGQLREINDRESLAKEAEASEATGFSRMEVAGFRELFLSSDTDDDSVLTFDEVTAMISNICPLGAKNMAQLQTLFRDITSGSHAEDDSTDRIDAVDFPEFLRFMRTLLDVNFANIVQRIGNFAPSEKA